MEDRKMEKRFFMSGSKKHTCIVEKQEDGTLKLTNVDGTPTENAGMLIMSVGGIDKFWNLCIPDETRFQELIAQMKFSQSPEYKKIKAARAAAAQKGKADRAATAFDELKKKCGDVIPATYANIGVVLRYLNNSNWGTWNLPKMSVGYSAQQYDCDGKTATAMILDKKIIFDEESGEMSKKFCVGAPRGYLSKYTRC